MSELFFIDLCQNAFEEICMLQTIITTLQDNCLNLELNCEYYENSENYSLLLSEERNRYINLLSIAKERLKNIENLNSEIENSIIA